MMALMRALGSGFAFWRDAEIWQRLPLPLDWAPAPREGLAPMARVIGGPVRLPDGRERRVASFELDVRAVSNGEWLLFVHATGAGIPPWMFRPGWDAPEQPVVGITQHEARAFARWARKRLPSEAEWQRAAGDGTYPWGERLPDPERACFKRRPGTGGPPADLRPAGAGPYGHRDLAGNVWERLDEGVARGGFWGSVDPRCDLRLVLRDGDCSAGVGFRCCR